MKLPFHTGHTSQIFLKVMLAVFFGSIVMGCKKDTLKETPLAFLNADVTLVNKAGFESAIVGLHAGARNLYFSGDGPRMWSMYIGTDVFTNGQPTQPDFIDYRTWLTPVQVSVNQIWNWAYLEMIPRANIILQYANKPTVAWANEAEKNAAIAEARFFRAFAYNYLANIYGGVPLVDTFYSEDKRDFARASLQQVYDFARRDLEYAEQWLPQTPVLQGRIGKAAAQHLLTEVYISLKQYDKAITTAGKVIDPGQYKLMTQRFGANATEPGDVYSDLFKDNNQNATSGNRETIWALQMEFQTPGGIAVPNQGNGTLRAFGNRYWNLQDPDKKAGMVVADSLGRGVGWIRPTSYFIYNIWLENPSDMRNSSHNIRREFYYNNPQSKYLGQKVDPVRIAADTGWDYYPTIRKIEGKALAGAAYGRTFKEFYMMRLAETYLLRAEAYFRNGNSAKAAEDINTVRARANAFPITPDKVSFDFLLDERARELTLEEPRRITLSRMGKLVERVKLYNPTSAASIQPYHALFPIPQPVIDANSGAALEQNTGY